MELVAADWVIIVLLGGSCLIALFRGLVREALSLVNWVVAALVARAYRVRFRNGWPNGLIRLRFDTRLRLQPSCWRL